MKSKKTQEWKNRDTAEFNLLVLNAVKLEMCHLNKKKKSEN